MKKILLYITAFAVVTNLNGQQLKEVRIDELTSVPTNKIEMPCTPSTSNISCNATSSFNITASGYVGNNPTAGDNGCNPCCYAGADLDCDGLQDVPFSVENSKWFKYCNTTAAAITITANIDEPGTGGTCNLQGAAWVGSTLSTAVMDCGNPEYAQFDSNVGGAADGFVFSPITVPAGECAWIMIDGYGGSTCAGASISIVCPVPLPVSLTTFKGITVLNENKISWSTASETNNDFFTLERSTNGVDFETVAEIDGAGTSYSVLNYVHTDKNFKRAINYYRLKQTNFDRTFEYSSSIVIDNNYLKNITPVRTTNMMGQEVNQDFEGVKLVFYSDGSVIKQFGN